MKRDNRLRALFVLFLLLVAWLLYSGYVVHTGQDLAHPTWDANAFPVRMQIWETFTDQLPNIVDGSNPKLALRTALESWAQTSSLSIIAVETSKDSVGQDGVNVVTIANTDANRNAVGSALGVSLSTIRTTSAGSHIIETDVVFNPSLTWSTVESTEFSTKNLFDVALHEFGHSWNLGHSINRTSTMHFQGGGFGFGFNQLAWDDVAAINVGYPLGGLDQITGSISGKVTRGASPVFGAFVVAVDEWGVLSASAITLPEGSYRLRFLPPGKYTLYVEPLDGPMTTAAVTGGIFNPANMVADFLPKFYNDSRAPSLTVTSGSEEKNKDFSLTQGNSAVDPTLMGTTANPSGGFSVSSSPADVFQGVNTNFIVAGKGVDKLLDDQGLSFLGSSLVAGKAVRQGNLSNGDPFRVFPVTIPLRTAKGEYPLILQTNPETGAITGGLKVFSPWRFFQAFAQFAHLPGAASSGLFLINTNLTKNALGKISTRSSNGSRSSLPVGSLTRDANNDLDLSLKAGGTLSAQSGGSSQFVGSLRAEADRRIGGTTLFETAFGTTGVGPSHPLYSFIAPVEVKDGGNSSNTGFALTNLDERPAKLYFQVQDENGNLVGKRIIDPDLEGNGQIARFITEIIPGLPPQFQGTVVVTSNRKIAATVIRTSPGVFTTFPVIQNRVSTRSFYAQFVHAGSLSSELLLVNPSRLRPANVQVQVRNSNGSAARVTLEGGEVLADGRKTLLIPPLGLVNLKTAGSEVLVGSVEALSEIPAGGVVLFRSPAVGTAGVGESFPLSRMVVPISRNRSAGADTGIAAVNTEDRPVKLKLTVRDRDGNVVGSPKEISLAARQQLARFPNEDPLSLNLADLFTGSLWIEAVGQMALTVIRQSPGVLTTFPAISLEEFITPANPK